MRRLFSIRMAMWSSRRRPFARSRWASWLAPRSGSAKVSVAPDVAMITAGLSARVVAYSPGYMAAQTTTRRKSAEAGGGGAGQDDVAVLVLRLHRQVGERGALLLADGGDGGGGRQGVARPDLLHDAHAVAGEALHAEPVGEHPARHPHGEHAVGEHRGIAG